MLFHNNSAVSSGVNWVHSLMMFTVDDINDGEIKKERDRQIEIKQGEGVST